MPFSLSQPSYSILLMSESFLGFHFPNSLPMILRPWYSLSQCNEVHTNVLEEFLVQRQVHLRFSKLNIKHLSFDCQNKVMNQNLAQSISKWVSNWMCGAIDNKIIKNFIFSQMCQMTYEDRGM